MKMTKQHSAVQASRAGFTLIEVLLVVAILGILAAVVVGNFSGQGDKARISATRASISTIFSAVNVFRLDVGRLPNSLDELVNQPSGAAGWTGPYVFGGVAALNDAWATPINYRKEGNTYKLISAGPDAQMGTEDDITSW